jgi:hypothetical protein
MSKNDPPSDPRSFSAFRALDDFSVAATNVLVDQSRAVLGIWGKMLQGNYNPKNLISDTAQLWAKFYDGAVELATLPISNLRKDAEQIASVVFVIDSSAGAAPPREVMSPVKLKDDVKIDWTPLRATTPGATHEVGREHVIVEPSGSGDAIGVRLDNLARLCLAPGNYLGAVYVVNGSPIRPVAMINLFVTSAGQHPGGTP